MIQNKRQTQQPSLNELRSLNDNLDENIERSMQSEMPIDDGGTTPASASNEQQTPPPDGEVQNRITE